MKIIEFKATTGSTALNIPVRGCYAELDSKRAYKVLSARAFAVYKAKVEADPGRFSEYEMRFCLWESEPDKDGIFRVTKTIYQDFRLIEGNVVMIKEQTFIK